MSMLFNLNITFSNHCICLFLYIATFNFWQPDNWTSSLNSANPFYDLSDGKLTVLEAGIYLIYAQVNVIN